MSRVRVQVDGRTAYVSGAASGIGRATAQRLSAHGCPMAIVDQNEAGLQETADTLNGPYLARKLDVRDRHALMAFAAEIREWSTAPIGMVFNNAGVAASQTVADGSIEDAEWVFQINFEGVVNGVLAFLPILLEQNSGVIVNTSSVFGLVGMPTQAAYCASKFAVRGYTDSLRQELRGTGVHAVNIHPGGVKTNIARNARYKTDPMGLGLTHEEASARFEKFAGTTPERAAEIIHRGVQAGKSRVLVGPDAYVFDALARLAPTRYYSVFAALEPLTRRLS